MIWSSLSKKIISAIEEWLSGHGIRSYSYNSARDWISISLPVSVACRLLDTEYYVFENIEDEKALVRAPQWSLPRHLHGYVETTQPTNSFFRSNVKRGLTDPDEVARFDKRDEIPMYGELAAVDLVSLGHIDIPNIKDLPNDSTPDEACTKIAISALCLRVLHGSLNYVPQVPEKQEVALVNYM